MWALLGGGGAAAVAAIAASWSSSASPVLLTALLLPPIVGLQRVASAGTRGLRRVVLSQIPQALVLPLCHLLGVTVIATTGWASPAAVALSLVVATVAACVAALAFLRTAGGVRMRQVAPAYRDREWLAALAPLAVITAVAICNGQITTVLLGWLSTDTQVGLMRVAERSASFVSLSLSVVNAVLAPHVARAFAASDTAALQKLARSSSRLAVACALPLVVVLVVAGERLLVFLFGQEFADASLPMAIVAVGQFVNVVFGAVSMMLTMAGYERETLFGATTGALLNVLGCVALVPSYGAVGAAWSLAASTAAWNILLAFRVKRRLGVRMLPF